MRKRKHTLKLRQFLAVALAVMIGVTFMPMLGGNVIAAEQDAAAPSQAQNQQDEITVEDIDGEFDLGDLSSSDVDVITEDIPAGEADDEDAPPADAFVPEELDGDADAAADPAEGILPDLKQAKGAQKSEGSSDDAGGITLKPNKSNGKLTVSGAVTGDTFRTLAVLDADMNPRDSWTVNNASFTATIEMSNYPIGGYYIVAYTNAGRTYYDVALTMIYDKPKNKKKQYETYSTYMFFKTNRTHYRNDYDCELYMDLKKKGAKKWKTYGPLSSTYTNTIKKLKPNKTYYAKLYYRKTVTLNGQSFYFSGKDNKKYTTVTIKTAKKKLPIKSVKAKAVNVKKFTHKRYGPATGLYLGKETWYTYRVKVTVKMKKKPGIKALYINGKKVKGNKKTYTVKFAKVNTIMYGKHKVKHYKGKWWKQDDYYTVPRGAKYTVQIYSYRNKTYKGYSNIQKRKTRLK